jgi:protein-tyrosine kinase
MTKIYEALEQTGKSFEEEPPSAPAVSAVERTTDREIEREMVRLYQNLNSILSDSGPRIIQFIGSREGEGTSTLVREFGEVAASKFNKRVLLLDADWQRPSQHTFFDIKPQCGWDEAAAGHLPIHKAIYRIQKSNLFLGPITPQSSPVVQLFNSNGIEGFWTRVKQVFDLVLLDSPPATTSPDGLAICRRVDGVILVVEAEGIRWPVVEKTKEAIQRNGGKVLGIVLNKRKFYIPEMVYRWL